MKKNKLKKHKQNNPVAKFARLFNHCSVEEDRTKYKRNRKHKNANYE